STSSSPAGASSMAAGCHGSTPTSASPAAASPPSAHSPPPGAGGASTRAARAAPPASSAPPSPAPPRRWAAPPPPPPSPPAPHPRGAPTYSRAQGGPRMAPASPATLDYMGRYTAGFSGGALWADQARSLAEGGALTMDRYLARFDRRCAINVACLVPNGNVRL